MLDHLVVADCKLLAENWLPSSSSAQPKVITIKNSNVARVPAGMRALEEHADSCTSSLGTGCPAAVARVRVLTLTGSNVTKSQKASLAVLHTVSLNHCRLENWLPVSSRVGLGTQKAWSAGNVKQIPEGLAALERKPLGPLQAPSLTTGCS
jgi:hypothetical protein